MSDAASDFPESGPGQHWERGGVDALRGFRRPRLRPEVPVLWRDQSTIQIGEDVIVDRVTRAHVAWLASLDGLSSVDGILDSLTIPESEAARLTRAALAAGALDDAARMPAAHRWLSPARRDPAIAAFGALLATWRDLDTATAMVDARDRARLGVVGTGPVAQAVRATLQAADLTVDPELAQLLVLADAPHPDVPSLADHVGLDRPHLHIGVYGNRAVVGPLVVPGRTSCLRCTQLHRRDADPAWPLVAVQWSHSVSGLRPAPVDPLHALLAAAHATLLVRSWIDSPESPDRWADQAVQITLPTGDATRIARPPHPLCGCRWLLA